jgi:hypothetical protein
VRSVLSKKRGAIELSMTTVVVIVLAMTMLALGLTLVRTLFTGAIFTATSLNSQVQNEINKIFQSETTKVGIISEQGKLEPARGKDNCIWWAIVADTGGKYDYTFSVDAAECGDATKGYRLTKTMIESWFTGLKGTMAMAPNQQQSPCLLLTVPNNAPSCLFKVDLEVKKDGVIYGGSSTYIRPKAATLFG